jgi:hypothetical protein
MSKIATKPKRIESGERVGARFPSELMDGVKTLARRHFTKPSEIIRQSVRHTLIKEGVLRDGDQA